MTLQKQVAVISPFNAKRRRNAPILPPNGGVVAFPKDEEYDADVEKDDDCYDDEDGRFPVIVNVLNPVDQQVQEWLQGRRRVAQRRRLSRRVIFDLTQEEEAPAQPPRKRFRALRMHAQNCQCSECTNN